MAHEAHPSLAALAGRKRVSTFKPNHNATWAKIHDVKQSLTNLHENKVVGNNVEYFKNHPDFNNNDDNKQTNHENENVDDKMNKNSTAKTKKKQKNKLTKLSMDDIKSLKAMIDEQKQQESNKKLNDNPKKESNKNLLNIDNNIYAADFMSMDFNSPQMLTLYNEMEQMIKNNDQ